MDRVARLREVLGRHEVEWDAPIEWPESRASTNDAMKLRAREGAPEWSVLCAVTQSGGRGREGRAWVSPPGGLYCSILLRPRFDTVGLLPLAAGVAVAEMAAAQGVDARLKWPNDVLVEERKVGGILTESSSGAVGVDWVVVGIGVNVCVEASALGSEVGRTATSLHLEVEQPLSVIEAAGAVLSRLRVWYDALGERPASVVDAWRARSVPWWGSFVQVRTHQGALRGKLLDVDETGALILETVGGGRGRVRRVLSGEVLRLRPLERSWPGLR